MMSSPPVRPAHPKQRGIKYQQAYISAGDISRATHKSIPAVSPAAIRAAGLLGLVGSLK